MVSRVQHVPLSEMLVAFLKAELDSPTERDRVLRTLNQRGEAESIIDQETATDHLYELFMDYRGSEQVFDGLDLAACQFWGVELKEEDLTDRVFTCRNHFEDRFNTRQLSHVCAEWQGDTSWLAEKADVLQPAILIADEQCKRFVVLEGHNRLIAHYKNNAAYPILAIVGVSDGVEHWSQW